MITKDFLRGAIDTHIHFGPDLLPRRLTALETARQAAQAGMRAIMLKNHVVPTYSVASAVGEAVGGVLVFGGVVLNTGVGGLNPAAVEAACALGAKQVWMPTASSVRHLEHFKGDPSKGVKVFDQDMKPMPGLMDVLELVAKADIILGTGHLRPDESARLVDLARQSGVRKVVVTHPEFICVLMPVEMQKELAGKGVFFERCYYATNSPQKLPVEAVADQIKAVGWQTTVVSSDFGQDHNPAPVDGLLDFLQNLARCGIAEASLEKMVKDHPASLLGL